MKNITQNKIKKNVILSLKTQNWLHPGFKIIVDSKLKRNLYNELYLTSSNKMFNTLLNVF